MNYWLHPDAEAELGDAAVYQAGHARRAVAEAFLAEFERVRDLLVENPYRAPHADFGLRAYHLARFPYTVVYEPSEESGPQIFAIAHQHREPGDWASRVEACPARGVTPLPALNLVTTDARLDAPEIKR